MDTNGQSNEQSNLRDKFSKAIEACQSLVKGVWQYKLGLGWIVIITALSVGLSVPLHRYFIEQHISNNIQEKVKKEARVEVENILKDLNLAEAIKNQNTGEVTKLIKLELHDWVKEEVKDSVSGLTSSTNFVLSFLASLPILYGFAFYLFQNGLIQKAVVDGSKTLEVRMEKNVQGKTQGFKKKLDQYKGETEDVNKRIREKYKLGLTRQIKIILSSVKIERLSSQQKADISNQDLEDLLRELEKLLEELEADKVVTRKDYVLLGDAYYANAKSESEYKQAQQAHQKALDLKDDDSVSEDEIYYKFGNDFAAQKQLDKAREKYNQIKEKIDNKDNVNYIWALHYGGHTYHEEYKYDKAIDEYDKAIEIEKKNSNYEALYQTLYYKGNSLAGLHKYEEAVACYEEALIIEQHFNWLWHSYGDALIELHDFSKAIEAYDEALKCDYSSFKYRAITIAKKADALTYLGRQENNILRYYDEALKQYEYALIIDNNNGKSYWGKARIYTILSCQKEKSEKAKYLQKALECYKKQIQILNDNSHISSRLAANYAFILQELGNQPDADYWYHESNKSIEVHPNKPDQYYNKACYYSLYSDSKNNDEYIKQACENLWQAIHGNYNPKSEQDKQSFKKWAEIDLDFDPIREDQRFKDVLEALFDETL